MTRYAAELSKKLVCEQGILSKPDPKKKHGIAQEIQNLVKNFYKEETISREMPGQKDCITMPIDGVKQKCLLQKNYIGKKINGYVTVMYENNWWLSYALHKDLENDLVYVSFLHPHGPHKSFYFPEKVDELATPKHTILTKVNPSTATGRFYVLSTEEMRNASTALSQKK